MNNCFSGRVSWLFKLSWLLLRCCQCLAHAPQNNPKGWSLEASPLPGSKLPHLSAWVVSGPRKGNVAQSQGRLQRLDRQLMPLERSSMDEKQELVNKPSSSFPTPHTNDSEGCSRVCLSEELQQDRACTAHSTTCPSVHAFPSRLFSSKLITPALCPPPPTSFPNHLYHSHHVQVRSGGSPN